LVIPNGVAYPYFYFIATATCRWKTDSVSDNYRAK
jgi:hypothetical protein